MPVSSSPSLDGRALDIRQLAGTKETIAYHDGGLFPVLAVAPSGVIVAVLRGGAGHLGPGGRIEIIRSRDAGASWSPPVVVADSDRDDRNPALGVTANGTLVLAYHRQGSYGEDGLYQPGRGPVEVMVTRSTDAGLTWDEPFPLGVNEMTEGSPFGKIVELDDGTLVLHVYVYGTKAEPGGFRSQSGVPDGSYLVRSHDDGKSWGEPSLISEGMDETGLLVLPDGQMLAVMRGTVAGGALWSSHSSDGGRTWTEPVQVTEDRQHPADLALLSDGSVLVSYGNRTPPYRIEGRVSNDGGHTWRPNVLALSAPLYGVDLAGRQRTDLGYPSTVVVGTAQGQRGVTVYYYNQNIPHSGKWQGEGTEGPFYRSLGYRAVSVTWDEAELIAALNG